MFVLFEESYVSETVLTDSGVVYTIIEGGNRQQTRSLVSNLGYGYTVKVLWYVDMCHTLLNVYQ